MRALITGASSGIGREIARLLAARGYDLVLAARREDRLRALAAELPTACRVIAADVADENECRLLYEAVRGDDLEIVVNNAGFGLYGRFLETDLDEELRMIDTNIRAVHILTKLAVRDFAEKNRGYVLNVASTASFFPGPLMAGYYASKNYVLRLTTAVREELRQAQRDVHVSALCPGPVETEFNQVAGVSFSLSSLSAAQVAKTAVNGMFAGKGIIVPGLPMKLAVASRRLGAEGLLARIVYHLQKQKS